MKEPSLDLFKEHLAGQPMDLLVDVLREGHKNASNTESTEPDADRLTAREREVLAEIALGRSYKEVAARLGISVKTVDYHRTNAMHRLGLHCRAEVVQLALRCGWLR